MGICQDKETKQTESVPPKKLLINEVKFGKTSVGFLVGSPLLVQCDVLVVPLIQKGDEILLDFEVFSEIKKAECKEDLETFIKTNSQSILEGQDVVYESKSNGVEAKKLLFFKLSSDEAINGDTSKNLNQKLTTLLESASGKQAVVVAIPQLLKLGSTGMDQSDYCKEVTKVTATFCDSLFNSLNKIVFASTNRKLVEDLSVTFEKASALGKDSITESQPPKGPENQMPSHISPEQQPKAPGKVARIKTQPVEYDVTEAQKAEADTAEKQRLEEVKMVADAAAKKKLDEEAAAAKKAHEEEAAAAKKKHEEEEAAKKKHEEEEAAKKKHEEEEAAKKKHEEEEAAKKKHEEEEAAKKKHEEEITAEKAKHEHEAHDAHALPVEDHHNTHPTEKGDQSHDHSTTTADTSVHPTVKSDPQASHAEMGDHVLLGKTAGGEPLKNQTAEGGKKKKKAKQ